MPEPSLASTVARGLVKDVEVRTNVGAARIDPFGAPGGRTKEGGGVTSLLLRLLQPEIIIHTSGGPLPVSPYGRPIEHGGLVGLALLAGVAFLLYRVVRR